MSQYSFKNLKLNPSRLGLFELSQDKTTSLTSSRKGAIRKPLSVWDINFDTKSDSSLGLNMFSLLKCCRKWLKSPFLTSSTSSHQASFTLIPVISFQFLLLFMQQWKIFVFESPSLIHLFLDFCWRRQSFLYKTVNNADISLFLANLSCSSNPNVSSMRQVS